VLEAVASYQQATRRLRALLDGVDSGLDVFTAMIEGGDSAAAVLLGTDASASRHEFAAAMAAFEVSRRRLRVAVLRLGQKEGEGVADLAKALGISRQLAYKLLAEGK